MDITIIAVGKMKETYLREAFSFYLEKIRKSHCLSIREIADEPIYKNGGKAETERIKEVEAEKIREAVPCGSVVVTLDIEGSMFTGGKLSQKLKQLSTKGEGHICFIIGGSWGLAEEIKSCGQLSLSLSPMTFPHQLSRIIILEQIDRLL